jgi:hypothetical protein
MSANDLEPTYFLEMSGQGSSVDAGLASPASTISQPPNRQRPNVMSVVIAATLIPLLVLRNC